MNAEQKQQAKQLIADWMNVSKTSTPVVWFLNGDCMAVFLQELVDAPEPEPFGYFKPEPFGWTDCAETDDGAIALYTAPSEPEPVARVTGYYAGYLSISTIDGRVLPAGTALYLAPPAPSVPDGWKLVPVEPTPEMMRSGMNVPVNKAARHNAVYRAMLKEAPQPPKLSDERILELFGFDGASDTVLGQLIRERCLQLGRAIEREILGGAYE